MAPLLIDNGARGAPQHQPFLYYNHPMMGQQLSAPPPPVAFVGGSRPWGFYYQQPPGSGGRNGSMSNPYPMALPFSPRSGPPLPTPPPLFAFSSNPPMGPFHPGFANRQPMQLVEIPRNILRRRNKGTPLVNDGCKKVSIIRRIREIFLRAGLKGGWTSSPTGPHRNGSSAESNELSSMIPRPRLEGRSSPSSSSSGPAVPSTDLQNANKKRRGLQRRPRIQQRPLPPPGVPRHRISTTTAPSENAGPTYDKLVFDKGDDDEGSSSTDDDEEKGDETRKNRGKTLSSSGQGSKQAEDQGISDDWDCSQSLLWSFSSTDQLYNNIGGRCLPINNKSQKMVNSESDDQAYSSIEEGNSSGYHHYYCPIFINNDNRENFQREHDFYNLDDDFDDDFCGFGAPGDVDVDVDGDRNVADVGFLGGGVEFCKCSTCAAKIFRRYQDPLASSSSCFFGRDGPSRRKPRGVLVDEVPHRWRQTRQISLDVRVEETRLALLPRVDSKKDTPGGEKAVMSLDRALMTTGSGVAGSENLRQDTVEFFTNPRRHVRRGTLDIVKPQLMDPDANRTSSVDEGVEADGSKSRHCACCPNSRSSSGKDGDWSSWGCEDERAWMIWNGRRLSLNCPYPKLPMTDWELSNVKERTRRILLTTNGPSSSFGTNHGTLASSTESWNYPQLISAATQDESGDKNKCLIPRNWKRKGSNSTWDQGPIDKDLVSNFDESEAKESTESKEGSTSSTANDHAAETNDQHKLSPKKSQLEDDGEDDPIGAGIREDDLKMSTVTRSGSNPYQESSNSSSSSNNKTIDSGVTKDPVSAQSSQNSDSGWESGGSYKRVVWRPSVGVSKQGDLSIDYSCSWKNLDEHWSMFV